VVLNETLAACPPSIEENKIVAAQGRGEGPLTFGDPGLRWQASSVRELSTSSGFLISGWVDTKGACLLDGFDDASRGRIVSRRGPKKRYAGPPNHGVFATFCGVALDIRRADGSTTTFFSSFARNASRHFHLDLQRDSSPHAPVQASSTLVVPSAARATAIEVAGLEVRRVRLDDERRDEGETWEEYRFGVQNSRAFDGRARNDFSFQSSREGKCLT